MAVITGKNGGDTLKGGSADDSIYGGNGNDSIVGIDGNDYISGSDGDDTLDGGIGNDSLYGGIGNDSYIGGDGNDHLNDVGGNNFFNAGNGNDTVYGDSGNDTVIGGDGNDSVIGWTGDDSISGGNGDDDLSGGEGNDTLDGGIGNDSLYGGTGNDTYFINSIFDYVYDSDGIDTAYVTESFVKIPSSIEKVNFLDGVQALPYWIDAMLPDETAGLFYKNILEGLTTINYIFPSAIPSYTPDKDAVGYMGFTATQITRTKEALNYISTLLNIQFISTTNAAQDNTIAFANNTQTDSVGYARYPDKDYFLASDVFLNKSTDTTFTLRDGEYQTLTLIHEIGHALGLEHPFSSTDAAGSNSDAPFLNGTEDSTAWTVMSYTDSSAQFYLQYSTLDIAALQYLYGPSKTSRTGNDTYTITSSTANFVWDGAGTDAITAGGVTQAATIYLTPGYQGYLGSSKAEKITTAGQITVNFGSVIENLIGSNYDDRLYGNEVANKIEGGAGNDLIEGWDGVDTLIGGAGNDTLYGGVGNDSIEGGDGNDTLIVSGLFSNYIVRYDSTTLNYSIEDKSGTDGTDTFKTVEFLKFTDKAVSLQSIDLTPPTIAVSSSLTSVAIGKIATITFAISETVSDFTLADIVVSEGTLSNFTGSGLVYSAIFTPSSNFTGTGSVKVGTGKFTDSSGNTNVDGDDSNNCLSISIDTQSPAALSYSPIDEATKVGVASDIVISFNELIQKGSGSVSIKTNAGVTVATYDILTSTNLTLSGTSLTINPSVTLAFDTGYKVEITSGTVKDLVGNEFPALTTYNFTTVGSIIGTAAGEILNGTALEDSILGYGGNDTITGGFGSDLINGGSGLDTVKFTGSFGGNIFPNYSIKKLSSEDWIISLIGPVMTIYPQPTTDGVDTLINVERIKFTDTSFALDLTGNAGITAKILGAVFGKDSLNNKNYVGIGLSFLDSGWTYDNLAGLALDAAGAKTNDQIVSLLWTNVIGTQPTTAEKAPYIALLENGMSAGALAHLAADTAFNITNINLVGLAQTGIEYIPV